MSKLITIAVDAMGGEGAPMKVIDGIKHHYNNNKNVFYKIFGDENHINPLILKKIDKKSYEIIHTTEKVFDADSPLEGAKKK